MKLFLLSLIFIGILFIIIGYVKTYEKCPPPRIEYRFVPRTFKEEQEQPVSVDEIFKDMFVKPTPWIGGFGEVYFPKREVDINRGFISQI
jgi:hypothetical protein